MKLRTDFSHYKITNTALTKFSKQAQPKLYLICNFVIAFRVIFEIKNHSHGHEKPSFLGADWVSQPRAQNSIAQVNPKLKTTIFKSLIVTELIIYHNFFPFHQNSKSIFTKIYFLNDSNPFPSQISNSYPFTFHSSPIIKYFVIFWVFNFWWL